MPETARQWIADNCHEHRRHGREGEQRGDSGTGDVEDAPGMPAPGGVTHRPGRW